MNRRAVRLKAFGMKTVSCLCPEQNRGHSLVIQLWNERLSDDDGGEKGHIRGISGMIDILTKPVLICFRSTSVGN